MTTCDYCLTGKATGATNAGVPICDQCWNQGEDGFVPD